MRRARDGMREQFLFGKQFIVISYWDHALLSLISLISRFSSVDLCNTLYLLPICGSQFRLHKSVLYFIVWNFYCLYIDACKLNSDVIFLYQKYYKQIKLVKILSIIRKIWVRAMPILIFQPLNSLAGSTIISHIRSLPISHNSIHRWSSSSVIRDIIWCTFIGPSDSSSSIYTKLNIHILSTICR